MANRHDNTFTGNITSKGAESYGKLTTFSIALYNGKDESPFFLRVKCFPNTAVGAKLEAKNRVAVKGSLRMERWSKDGEDKEALTVYANGVTEAPWEGAAKAPGNAIGFDSLASSDGSIPDF